MTEKKFDDIIKNKLKDLSAQADAGSWSAFESKLSHIDEVTSDSTQEFDNTIKEKVLENKPSYKSEHWQLLKKELKGIEERKNGIYLCKVMEFFVVFLIVITMINITGGLERIPNNANNAYNLYAGNSINSNPAIDNKNAQYDVCITMNGGVTNNINKTSSNSANRIQSTPLANTIHTSTSRNDLSIESLRPNNSNLVSTISKQSPWMINVKLTQNTHEVESRNGKDEPHNAAVSEIAHLKSLEIEELYSEMARIIPLKLSKTRFHKPTTFVSVWGSKEVNLINTPFDKFYSLASYKKEALNTSYGINISKSTHNLEIESGIGYSKREYQPRIVTEVFGVFGEHYFEKTLNKISFDIATLPINFKYHFLNSSGWSSYLLAGSALNVVMNAEYDITESLVRGRLPVGRYVPEQARLDSKPFIKGMLQGDNLKDNYFIALGFGFGIEKSLFNSTSIYVQPSYYRHIFSGENGIGPNKDKIHTSSIQIGLKTSIN